MDTAIIVQARMTSTRLPGKVLKTVMNKPLLAYQIERLKRVQHADGIVLAITTNSADDVLGHFASEQGVTCFRGSELDVLGRYYNAALSVGAQTVVRITSDCPLIEPAIVDQIIQTFRCSADVDYVSNTLTRTYPRGLDVECFSFAALKRACLEATENYQREHVTPYIYQNKKHFRVLEVLSEVDYSSCRWTVDTDEDYQLIKLIIENLYCVNPAFSWHDVLKLLQLHPTWAIINAHVEQKKISEAQKQ